MLYHHGIPVDIGPKAVEMLAILLQARGAFVERNALLETLWPDGRGSAESLWQCVRSIRKVLDPMCGTATIKTLPRRGYRFTLPVTPGEGGDRTGVRKTGHARSAAALFTVLLAIVAIVDWSHAHHDVKDDRSQRALDSIAAYNLHQRTVRSLTFAAREFMALSRAAPKNARLLAQLSESVALLKHYAPGVSMKSAGSALALAQRAVVLDPQDSEAHTALGLATILGSGNVTSSATELRKATALDPKSSNAHLWYGAALLRAGSIPAARKQFEIAVEVDPTSAVAYAWLARAAIYGGSYQRATALSKQALELNPNCLDTLVALGLSYELRGRSSAATAVYHQILRANPAEGSALLAHAYAFRLSRSGVKSSITRSSASLLRSDGFFRS